MPAHTDAGNGSSIVVIMKLSLLIVSFVASRFSCLVAARSGDGATNTSLSSFLLIGCRVQFECWRSCLSSVWRTVYSLLHADMHQLAETFRYVSIGLPITLSPSMFPVTTMLSCPCFLVMCSRKLSCHLLILSTRFPSVPALNGIYSLFVWSVHEDFCILLRYHIHVASNVSFHVCCNCRPTFAAV